MDAIKNRRVEHASPKDANHFLPLGGIVLGIGDDGTGQCLYYPDGMTEEEAEKFFEEDNKRLAAKWKAKGLVG